MFSLGCPKQHSTTGSSHWRQPSYSSRFFLAMQPQSFRHAFFGFQRPSRIRMPAFYACEQRHEGKSPNTCSLVPICPPLTHAALSFVKASETFTLKERSMASWRVMEASFDALWALALFQNLWLHFQICSKPSGCCLVGSARI